MKYIKAKVDSFSFSFSRRRALIFGLVGALTLLTAFGVTIGTHGQAELHGGYYVLYVGTFSSQALVLPSCLFVHQKIGISVLLSCPFWNQKIYIESHGLAKRLLKNHALKVFSIFPGLFITAVLFLLRCIHYVMMKVREWPDLGVCTTRSGVICKESGDENDINLVTLTEGIRDRVGSRCQRVIHHSG